MRQSRGGVGEETAGLRGSGEEYIEWLTEAKREGTRQRRLETSRATLDWYKSLGADLQALVAPQFAKAPSGEFWPDRERRLLAAWRHHEKKG